VIIQREYTPYRTRQSLLVFSICTTIYLEMLKLIIQSKTKTEIREYLVNLTKSQLHENVITLLQDALNGNNARYIGKPSKGWVCHSLYIAINAFLHFDTYLEAMKFIIKDNPGSDTDTNGAIAGALLEQVLDLVD